jgi:hypothetical protein
MLADPRPGSIAGFPISPETPLPPALSALIFDFVNELVEVVNE